ncbi:hypothetical protein T10_7005, partial [Trichinella papuae]
MRNTEHTRESRCKLNFIKRKLKLNFHERKQHAYKNNADIMNWIPMRHGVRLGAMTTSAFEVLNQN